MKNKKRFVIVVALVLIIGGYIFISKLILVPVKPPATVITFAQTVNFIADQFTEKDVLKAKELGVNMITIWPALFIRDDEFIFFPGRIARSIVFAHKNGLQVELRNSFGGEIPKDYEKFKANALEYVARFAEFAEKYQVYRIVPFGEVDNILFNNQDKIAEFSKEMLQEMRKYYSGKVGVGIAAPWRDSGYSFKGYDYMTISAYPQASTGMDAWLTENPEVNVHNVIAGARKVADRSGISLLHVGEVGVINPDDQKRPDFKSFAMVSKEKEAEFFSKFFEQISNKVNGISVFYNSKFNYFSVNNDPAEDVVKEWFGKPFNKTVSGQSPIKSVSQQQYDDTIPSFKNLGVNFDGINSSGGPGDIYFQPYNPYSYEISKPFLEFGAEVKDPLGNPKYLYEFFYSTLPDKSVLATIDGIITRVEDQGGGDYEIDLKPKKNSEWIVNYDHVINPIVTLNSQVTAGQKIAETSGGFELATLRTIGGDYRNSYRYCPLYSASAYFREQISGLMISFETLQHNSAIYDESRFSYAPGCVAERVVNK